MGLRRLLDHCTWVKLAGMVMVVASSCNAGGLGRERAVQRRAGLHGDGVPEMTGAKELHRFTNRHLCVMRQNKPKACASSRAHCAASLPRASGCLG